MKEVEKKDLPEISGGDDAPGFATTPISPYYPPPLDYPRQPFGPVCEMPSDNPIE